MDRAAAREVEAMIEAELSRAAPEARAPGRMVLVDGFNVLHAVLLAREREAGWWKREARERLLRRVGSWPTPLDEIWVAFDGARPAWSVWAEPVAVPQPRNLSVSTQPRDSRARKLSSVSSPVTPGSALDPPLDPTLHPAPDPALDATLHPTPESVLPLEVRVLGPIVHSVFVESADDWIVRRARRAPDPARLLVVTADRQVAGRSRSAGAEIATPWAFMSRCPSAGDAAVDDDRASGEGRSGSSG